MSRTAPKLVAVIALLAFGAAVLFVLWPEEGRGTPAPVKRRAAEPEPAQVVPEPVETAVVESLEASDPGAFAATATRTPEAAAEIALFEHGTARVVRWWGDELVPGDGRAPCEVIVVDMADRPVAGALVEVSSPVDPQPAGSPPAGSPAGQPPDILETSVTDAAGRCTVQPHGVQPWMRASVAGVSCSGWEQVLHVSASRDQPRLVVLPLAPVHVEQGLVLHADGAPGAGARVIVGNEGMAHMPAELVAGLDGRFTLEVHDGEGAWLRAEWGRAVSAPVRARAAPGEELRLVLREPVRVPGRVVTAEGVGASGVEVQFLRERTPAARRAEVAASDGSRGRLPARERTPAISDASGRFVLEVEAPDRGWVCAKSSALVERPVPLQVVPGEIPPELEVRLAAPSAIRGRIVDASGAPIAGATLFARAQWPVPGPTQDSLGVTANYIFGGSKTASEPDGSFLVPRLSPSVLYTLVARDTRSSPGWELAREGIRGDATGLVLVREATAFRTGVVAGVVRSARDDEPVRGALRCAVALPDGQVDHWDFPSDESPAPGSFRCDRLVVGTRCDLLLMPQQQASVLVRDVLVAEEGAGDALELLAPAPGDVECRVAGPDGPVPWALVLVDDADLPYALRNYCEWRHVVRTDDTGLTRVEGLRPGRWSIEARSGERVGRGDVLVEAAGVAELVIELR